MPTDCMQELHEAAGRRLAGRQESVPVNVYALHALARQVRLHVEKSTFKMHWAACCGFLGTMMLRKTLELHRA